MAGDTSVGYPSVMRRLSVAPALLALALAGCQSAPTDAPGGDGGDGVDPALHLQVSKVNDLRVAASSAVGNTCDLSGGSEPDFTGAEFIDCKVAGGVPVRFSYYPSKKQAADGKSYLEHRLQVYGEDQWVVSVNGDPEHLQTVLTALADSKKK